MSPPDDYSAERTAQAARNLKAAEKAYKSLSAAAIDHGKVSESVDNRKLLSAQKLVEQTALQREALLELLQAEMQYKASLDGQEAAVARLREQIRELNEVTSGFADIAGSIQARVQGMWGITNQWSSDITATMAAGIGSGKSFGSVLDELADRTETMADRQNRWGSTALKMTEGVSAGLMGIVHQSMTLTNAIDQQTSAFKRATGASQKFVNMIEPLEAKYYSLGLSMEDASALMGSLYSSTSAFTSMSSQHQNAVKRTAAVLSTMGVEAETSANTMEILTRSMGMTGTQAANVTGQLFSLAGQLDISTQKMMSDFTTLGPQLMEHGRGAIGVFIQLEAAAKESGMAIEKLVSTAKQFDTFKGAADSVSQLNAILGGTYLSTMRMVEATNPVERMQMLSQSVRSAGLEFDTMNYYQRQAIAGAMGLSDVNDLALVMRGRFNMVNEAVSMSADEIENLAKENQHYKNVQDELAQALRAFAVPATQLLNWARDILQWFQESPNAITNVTYTVIGFKGAMLGLNTAATMAAAGLRTFLGVSVGIIGPIGGMIAAVAALHYVMTQKRHSPPLFGENSAMALAASQTYGLAGSLSSVTQQAYSAAKGVREVAAGIDAVGGDKKVLLDVERVFTAQEKTLQASANANITGQTIALLGAASGQQMAGKNAYITVDSTLEVSGKALAVATSKHTAAV